MSLFRNFFGGGQQDEDEDNGAEYVETLVERAETCTAPEDRRDALRGLKGVAKKYRLAVGTMGMNAFIDVLETDRMNTEAMTIVLDTMAIVLSTDDDSSESDELGERLAEVMIKRKGFISSVLCAVEQFDIGVRRTAIQLISNLLRHRGTEVQKAVMEHPQGIAKLVDVIHDNREIIRNEAILMICELSRANSQVQQLLAYDNIFLDLLNIIETEPLDSIVIEDCMFVMLNLLRKHAMNQQIFREDQFVARLGKILHTFLYGNEETEDIEVTEWAKQRTANVIFLLQIIRTLVSPDNTSENTHAAQKVLNQTKILEELCRVLLSEIGASVEILTESIIVVAEAIRGNYTNQELFANTVLDNGEDVPRTSLVVLLISMTAEKQPYKLRCAVFYCFLSYLFDNEFGKARVIETLLPQSHNSSSSLTTGALILQAISSAESVQAWFGCVTLMHCLYDVDHLSEQLLRVNLTVVTEDPPLTLLNHVCQLLVSTGNRRPQTRAGLLMLLGTWLQNCPAAVSDFMAKDEHIQYLTTNLVDECGEGSESEQQVLRGLMAFVLLSCLKNLQSKEARSSMEILIQRRVGKELILSALEGLSRTEQFVRAAQKQQPTNELFLDFHFVKLFKSLEGTLAKQLKPNGEFNGTSNDSIIQSYKELIKRQDGDIAQLKQDNKRMSLEIEKLNAEVQNKQMEREVENLRVRLEESEAFKTQNEVLNSQLVESQRLTQQWYAEAERYKQWAQQWQAYQLAQLPNGVETGLAQLQQQVNELEQQLGFGYQAFEQQSQTMLHYTSENANLKDRLAKTEAALAEANYKIEQLNLKPISNGIVVEHEPQADSEEFSKLKQEQEELLMLLADQHNKMSAYRRLLRNLKQPVTDDEDE
ncbi:Uso1_p115_head domain-containing protein [Caenorhabditis elegans]|nr:Uso1_p115_head domain-containing protein [Caenorhabditis elegans]CAJ76944.1 Uso1_p115_head domain-containing protein [Caenorhabditis elegans]|eukprot:NP_001040974.1 USO1 (yeast transport protein) homolog [Caenorhabditis elegans]